MATMPHLSSSPPQESNDDEAAAVEEEEEFGELKKCPGATDESHVSSWETVSTGSSTLQPGAYHSPPTINTPVEQSQPTPTVSLKAVGDQATTGAGSSDGYLSHDGDRKSALKSCFLSNETDFADFSVFGEQAAQAWCCGLSGSEFWDGEGITAQKGLSVTSGEVAILDSEPRSSASVSKDICTKVYHCEEKNTLSQDFKNSHFQSDWGSFVDKSGGKSCESHKERKHSFNLNFLRTSKETGQKEEREKTEKSVSTLCQTRSLYDFVDNASCDDASSQDEPSEDFEPNVSSLASQEDTDTEDQTDDEEELRNYRLSRSFCNDYIWYNLETSTLDVDAGLFYQDHYVAQESSATSVDSECEKHSEEDQVFRCVSLEGHMSQVQLAEEEVQGSLQPSDSFADFCSAPSHEDGDCALFPDRQEAFGQQCDVTSCQIVLHCQVEQLFLDSFPQLVSAAEVEDVVNGLEALLVIKDENDLEKEDPSHSGSFCVRPGIKLSSQDLLSAAGLRFRWPGSHMNRCLHQCLGVDSNNILFIGIKKQPVVPTFGSHQGLLEHFPGRTAVTTHATMRT